MTTVKDKKKAETEEKAEKEPEAGVKVKEQKKEAEIPPIFEVSEQEEIEYLNQEGKEKPEVCGTEGESSSKEAEQEDLVNRLKLELEQREEEILQLKNQIEEFKGRLLRNLAELENIRKRTEREKEEYYQYALSDLLKELLSILDNFERALKTSEEETNGKTFREGVELIYRLMLNLLRKYGVQPIEIQDRKFDPALHHAVMSEESEEVTEPEVKEELQKGYLIHNRLLRPSMVKVVVPKKN
jgi:molecular chaperone GrpE